MNSLLDGVRMSYGLTEVHFKNEKGKGYIYVTHTGNMGDRIKDVLSNLRNLLGSILDSCTLIKESGSPDYLYEAVYGINKKAN